jgi:hypothetical protein
MSALPAFAPPTPALPDFAPKPAALHDVAPTPFALPNFATHGWRITRIALHIATSLILSLPRSLDGVFRSIVHHINA